MGRYLWNNEERDNKPSSRVIKKKLCIQCTDREHLLYIIQ